ncbi:hypothetical protein [Halostella sp. PRR32]|uniref:hypothetical protein n=1 Tax=Halostella sp. PRR32 TaxID=3098147 RepID=UPI002B1E1868|nr:hypothetical protein [Halostella sp. PRR32]
MTVPLAGKLREEAQTAYNRAVRPHLPYKVGVFNGVASRRIRLLDLTDTFPDYEAAVVDATRERVGPGDEVVVVGGGYGVTSVAAARAAGPDGHVTTYEPARNRFEIARHTASLNEVEDRVSVRRKLVGPGVKIDGEGDRTDRVSPSALPDCDVLELDCEGAEAAIIESMTARPRSVVVETHGCFGTPESDTREALAERGYEVIDRTPDEPDRGIVVLTAERVTEHGG